jgi:hypothetical protein
MLSLYKYVIALCIPMNGRELSKKKVDIQIACYENILNCRLSWREREDTFYKLSDLYYYKYILDNVKNYKVNILPDELLCYENTTEGDENGFWYIIEDF